MSPNRPIVLGLTGHGTLEGFEGRRGSGIGFLKIRDDETGRVLRIPAENVPTARPGRSFRQRDRAGPYGKL